MDFTLEAEIEETRRRIRAFVAEHVLPLEGDPAARDAHDNMDMSVSEAGVEGPVPGAMTAVAPNMAIATLAVTGMT